MLEINDNELVKKYLNGDKESLEILIKKYLKPVYGFVYYYVGSVEAEDITQEVFVRVWKNIKKFDLEKSFKTWIFAIAKNASLDFIKKKKAIPFSDFEGEDGKNVILDTLSDPAPLPDEILAQKDISSLVTSALEKLPPKHRLVIYLYYINQLNFREIAEVLNEPLDTVKSRQRRALIALRGIISKEF